MFEFNKLITMHSKRHHSMQFLDTMQWVLSKCFKLPPIIQHHFYSVFISCLNYDIFTGVQTSVAVISSSKAKSVCSLSVCFYKQTQTVSKWQAQKQRNDRNPTCKWLKIHSSSSYTCEKKKKKSMHFCLPFSSRYDNRRQRIKTAGGSQQQKNKIK